VNNRAALGLTAGALTIGVLAGLALGGNGGGPKQTGPGPKASIAGVPIGYERSKAGAASAALNYETALTAAGPAGYRTVLGAITDPSDRNAITEAMQPGMEIISKQLGEGAVVRSAVLGYRVNSYDSNVAEVEVWEVGTLAAANQPVPQAGWTTTTVRVRWSDGDWRIAEAPTTKKGPTPQQPDEPTETQEFIDSIRPLAGAHYVAAP
jgi:hypothetical protein